MNIEEIKKAQKKVDQLEKIQFKLKELEKSDNIDSVSIKCYESGSYSRSYDVSMSYNECLMQTVKSLMKDYLRREEKKVIQEIKNM